MASLSFAELVTALRLAAESRGARERRLEAVRSAWSGRLVFVCYGNIMRSAFAAAYVQREHPALAARVCGAGTHARPGKAAEPTARMMAAECGVDLTAHAATRVVDARLGPGDVVVCMDLANAARVVRTGVDARSVFLIGDAAGGRREVEDPYGRGESATREAFERLRACCDAWIRVLGRAVT